MKEEDRSVPPDETPSSGPSDHSLEEELRAELHTQVDSMFEAKTGLDFYVQCLALAGRLLKAGGPAIDALVGHELICSKSTALPDALTAGEDARNEAAASVYGLGGRAEEPTSKICLLGASTTVQQLAVFSDDPYLRGLAAALRQLRHGQLHPWLVSPKASAHPKHHASDVLAVKLRAFCVVEYLVASAFCTTKTAAQGEVLDRLGISADTFSEWRKQQRKHNAADFDVQRSLITKLGKEVGKFRRRAKEVPGFGDWVEWHDEQFGLSVVDRCARMLKELGAHKGQK